MPLSSKSASLSTHRFRSAGIRWPLAAPASIMHIQFPVHQQPLASAAAPNSSFRATAEPINLRRSQCRNRYFAHHPERDSNNLPRITFLHACARSRPVTFPVSPTAAFSSIANQVCSSRITLTRVAESGACAADIGGPVAWKHYIRLRPGTGSSENAQNFFLNQPVRERLEYCEAIQEVKDAKTETRCSSPRSGFLLASWFLCLRGVRFNVPLLIHYSNDIPTLQFATTVNKCFCRVCQHQCFYRTATAPL